MIRGTLSSPPFARLHLYTEPVNVLLRYDDIDKDPFKDSPGSTGLVSVGQGKQGRLRAPTYR